MSHPKYPNLFSPIKLGPVTARNRVLQAVWSMIKLDIAQLEKAYQGA